MRLIDADALEKAMYKEIFEKDTDMQKWDSGCWIRFKLFENVMESIPTIWSGIKWHNLRKNPNDLPNIGDDVIIAYEAYIILRQKEIIQKELEKKISMIQIENNNIYNSNPIIIAPLRYGAGIKGKVIEAMYNGVPVVTTKCGAEGIETDALVVDETLLSINDLYENKERLLELSKKEYEFMVNSYSMDNAKESFQLMVDELNK